MWLLVLTIFSASLLGSLHCAGMCGAFVALAIQTGNTQLQVARWKLQTAYHTGRLVTYGLLGAMAGLLGGLLNLAGGVVGWQQVAAVGAGLMMILFGTTALARTLGLRLPHLPLPALLQRLVIAGQTAAQTLLPLPRAAVIGLLTTLLPCGWLWIFVATAAGTASPTQGLLVMGIFWLGTLPVLVTLGLFLGKLHHVLAARLPLITSLLIIGVGLYTLTMRMHVTPQALAQSQSILTDPNALPACCQPTTTSTTTNPGTQPTTTGNP